VAPATETGGPSGVFPVKNVTVPSGWLPKLRVAMETDRVTNARFTAVVGLAARVVLVGALVITKVMGCAVPGRKLGSPR